ncbi:class I SAM-dependent methyltransferase [Phenylobacterium sp.]|uniref:class I SAM-dependent methyltransferase n=1 Tax=Phenylobacterium sp. TaxID=1871053 RepID=UPI002732084C|nr:SAM-dependent methyltransferase [Phenylobacterium sp.]MDP1616281.1 SAM-dependent methyltransferase [Phenylobacterium sp.]MDP1987355.1 SAM-dependent methyltransferase [Phenylobacterium sp.]
MDLRERLAAQIAATGPLSLAQYMTICLHDPQAGYYATRPGLGADGDFITAPLVSQMFGELIGLWAAATWQAMGSPSPFRLVEMGPGDGTLMADLLRAGGIVPGFLEAADLWLVEVSAPLRALQAERLAQASAQWADSLDGVPEGAPMILVANELLDCLPTQQFVRTEQGWAERMVGLNAAGELVFGLSSALPREGRDGEVGEVFETSPAQQALGAQIGARLAADGGAALLIDYGPAAGEPSGDTFQALQGHEKVDPLACPGQADLTFHADFLAVAQAAQAEGATAAPLLTQAEFLRRMGIEARAQALAAAQPARAAQIGRQFDRLTAQDQMGALFKVLCLHGSGPAPPAFEADGS